MLGCIYQLWDWLEAPPFFSAANMDAKKLLQLQQQQQQQQQHQQQKKLPLAYQTNINDYRSAAHSPVFQQQLQQHPQQQQQQNYHVHQLGGGYQQSPTATSNSSSGPLTPVDVQPQASKLLLKSHMSNTGSSSSQHSSPYNQQQYAGGEQLYQSPSERAYLSTASRLQATSKHGPSTALQQQYQQLQQAKMQVQLQTQTEAMQQQQRTFALRQQVNPPVPQAHYHMSQSSSLMSTATQQQQHQPQQQSPATHQRAPPSTLNLSSQFQPASGPLKVGSQQKTSAQQQQQEHGIYVQQQHQLQLQLQLQHQQQLQQQHQQQQQRLKVDLQTPGGSEHSPVYIQQNHPGHVTNQACQTQISAVKSGAAVSAASKTPSSEDSASKSPAHAPLDRKKSAGSTQALKSPVTKRPATSAVTISGWLYKQGSDGLKVWRKRWFVLAEYCLYYYKGPEEEKLLGSVLLPSYRVSACLPEDRIYRKFAFKCEHQNMRTYWLAAESAESMVQWVRALTAATMMQAPSSGESDQTSQPSAASSVNHSGENSDSGIHTLQSQQSKMSPNQGPATPASDSANMQSATISNSGGSGGGAQPLYANAPPKPRRINDGGYSSPSPEHCVDIDSHKQQLQHHASRHGGVMSPTLQQQQQYQQQQQQQQQLRSQQHHVIYDTRTGNVTSTLRLQQQQPHQQHQLEYMDTQFQQQLQLDDFKSPQSISAQQYIDMEEQIVRLQHQQQQQQQHQRSVAGDDLYGERELHMQKLIHQRYAGLYPNAERRTPDAYGRSKNRVLSDYEDIYNLNQTPATMQDVSAAAGVAASSYRRPLSPPIYESNKHVPSIPAKYTPNQLESSAGATASSAARSRSATAAIVRPHSADFLEYETRSEAIPSYIPAAEATTAHNLKTQDALQAQRPKSSLDINRTPDSIYYSEASYAEKMRKSALYLQHPQTSNQVNLAGAQPQHPSNAYRSAAADIYGTSGGGGVNTSGYENPYERVYKRNELLPEKQGAASMPRMSRSTAGSSTQHAAANRSASTLQHPHHQLANQQLINSPTQQQAFYQPAAAAAAASRQQEYPPQQQQQQQQSEQLLRSASARLPKRSDFDDEYVAGGAAQMATGASATGGGTSSALSHQEGERKREESMKRLLEWKQRMLHSPLTRKGVQQTVAGGPGSNMTAMSKLGSNPNLLLTSTAVASGARRATAASGLSAGNAVVGGVSGIQRSRSETHANGGTGGSATGYNSYSSDDEASISVRNVRNLPKSSLVVKPNPVDPYPEQTLENYDQMQKLTNSYYGNAQDTKYAKTTTLTDKVATGDTYFGSNGAMLASSTPAHGGNSSHGGDHYGINGRSTGINSNLYDVHQSGYQSNQAYPMRRAGSRADIDLLERETSTQMRNLDVSAGDLLSRTHEELVLLLIQLRRQNSNTARAIEQCCSDIHEVQNRLRTAEGLTRAESIQRLDYLKQHLLDLERQYDKSKPLVNLVDNMVKLGSLYRSNDVNGQRQTQQQQQQQQQQLQPQQHQRTESATLDRIEFNQRIQEERMLQEEQKQWDRLTPNQSELQSKVQQLYYLDQLLQEESGTLQSLQRDKEDLERALGGIRARIQDVNSQPLALEAARKQQHLLERELSRVHQLLAENSKNTNWRARDDLDMEVALRPRMNAPDVVRSALGHGEKISENTIDNLLLAPNKILIPERYIPEKAPELSPEEKKRRQEKVESIKKMLAETPISTANDALSLPPSKINAEKKQREHLLQLNQILAQQVMQMSKIVAGNPSSSNQK